MPAREEVIVSAVPLSLRVERGAGTGELRVDPIELAPHHRLVLRPEGFGVVLERERAIAMALDDYPFRVEELSPAEEVSPHRH
jgi:hypothetical protein